MTKYTVSAILTLTVLMNKESLILKHRIGNYGMM